MAHVRREYRQPGVEVGTFAIPAEQRMDGKGVAQIVETRSPAATGMRDAALMQQLAEGVVNRVPGPGSVLTRGEEVSLDRPLPRSAAYCCRRLTTDRAGGTRRSRPNLPSRTVMTPWSRSTSATRRRRSSPMRKPQPYSNRNTSGRTRCRSGLMAVGASSSTAASRRLISAWVKMCGEKPGWFRRYTPTSIGGPEDSEGTHLHSGRGGVPESTDPETLDWRHGLARTTVEDALSARRCPLSSTRPDASHVRFHGADGR